MNELQTSKKEIVLKKCKFDGTHLEIDEDCSKEEWLEIGIQLRENSNSLQWYIGDWIIFGEKKYKKYKEALEKTGYSYGGLRNLKLICKTFEVSRRHDTLAFMHHAEVISLDKKKQDELLSKAEKERLSAKLLRKLVKQYKNKLIDTDRAKLPEGKFNIIYADPPWQYDNTGFDMSVEKKYTNTLSIDQISNYHDGKKDLKECFAENAVLLLWTTNPLLEDAFKVVNAWGFDYKTNFVYIKKNHTAGFYVYGQHELLLVCVKGDKMLPTVKYKSIIQGDNKIHSKKPDIVYGMIEKMYPNCKYLELFARNERGEWISYGNEIQ